MRPRENMTQIIDRVRYSVSRSTLLAHDEYWDGAKHIPVPKPVSMWQGERDHITPLTAEEAYDLYERLEVKEWRL